MASPCFVLRINFRNLFQRLRPTKKDGKIHAAVEIIITSSSPKDTITKADPRKAIERHANQNSSFTPYSPHTFGHSDQWPRSERREREREKKSKSERDVFFYFASYFRAGPSTAKREWEFTICVRSSCAKLHSLLLACAGADRAREWRGDRGGGRDAGLYLYMTGARILRKPDIILLSFRSFSPHHSLFLTVLSYVVHFFYFRLTV